MKNQTDLMVETNIDNVRDEGVMSYVASVIQDFAGAITNALAAAAI